MLSKSKRANAQADVHLFYHYDGQGNVVQLTGATQATVATYSYDAFGNDRGTSGAEAAGNLYRFSTKEFQAYSGLYDYGLRFYSPGMGRFINRDPSGEAGGLNLYAAFANDPLSNVDAYGLSASSMAAAFSRGVWDGAFSLEGGKALIEGAIMAAATAFLMGSCCPIVPLLTMAIGAVGAAVGIGGLLEAVTDILYSDLCPDEKAYQLGKMVGTMLAGAAGGALGGGLGGKMGAKTPRCFVAGTLVLMADGTQKAIEQVKEGELVMARDEATGQTEAHRVEHKSVRHVEATRVLFFSDGSKVETTDEHPFYVESRGFLPAKEAGVGTSIVTRAGPTLQVTKVEVKTQGATVYNFTVEGLHTYFVGNGLWVHNGCGTPDGPTEPEVPTEPVTRVRHYTKKSSAKKIAEEKRMVASDQDKIFVEKASRKVLSPKDAEAAYAIKPGKGNSYIEFDAPASRVLEQPNSRVIGGTENYIKGNLDIPGDIIVKHRG